MCVANKHMFAQTLQALMYGKMLERGVAAIYEGDMSMVSGHHSREPGD